MTYTTTEHFVHLLNVYGEDRAEKDLTSWEPKTPAENAQWWYLCFLLWCHRETYHRDCMGSSTHAAVIAEPILRKVGRDADAETCRAHRYALVRMAFAAASRYTGEYPYTYAEWCARDAA